MTNDRIKYVYSKDVSNNSNFYCSCTDNNTNTSCTIDSFESHQYKEGFSFAFSLLQNAK